MTKTSNVEQQGKDAITFILDTIIRLNVTCKYLTGIRTSLDELLEELNPKDKSYTLLHIKEIKILLDNIETLISETFNDCQIE